MPSELDRQVFAECGFLCPGQLSRIFYVKFYVNHGPGCAPSTRWSVVPVLGIPTRSFNLGFYSMEAE